MDSKNIKNATGMLLDGVFASEAIDSSGEILDIEGLDITDFLDGVGLANYEHKDSSGDSNGQEIVGKILPHGVKKIFSKDDCETDRQRMFWDRTRVPFLYGTVRLYDGAGHDGAKALAANIRDSVANDEPIIVRYSIEGTTLDKKGNRLASTIARKVAMTTKPCNKQAVSGLLSDPLAPEGFEKYPSTKKSEDLMNSVLGGSETVYGAEMLKALSAGSYNAAPGTLTGGAALQREDRTLKAVAMAAKRDWPKTGKFRDFLKERLGKADFGEVSDDFLDHFSDQVEANHYRIKKSEEVIAALKKAGKQIATKPVETPKLVKTEPVEYELTEGTVKIYNEAVSNWEIVSKLDKNETLVQHENTVKRMIPKLPKPPDPWRALEARLRPGKKPAQFAETIQKYEVQELPEAWSRWVKRNPEVLENFKYSKSELSFAQQHAAWQLQYGEIPAQILHYRYQVPQLVAQGIVARAHELILKSQSDQIEQLAKADGGNIPTGDGAIDFQGKKVVPGTLRHNLTDYHILANNDDHFVVHPKNIHGTIDLDPQDIKKIPKNDPKIDAGFTKYPTAVDNSSIVDVNQHGIPQFTSLPHSKALAHGFDFSQKKKPAYGDGAWNNSSFWGKTADGKNVFMKGAATNESFRENAFAEGPFNTARREGIYHNLGHNFFGLGNFLANTAVVRHPQTGQEYAMIEHVDGKTADHAGDDKNAAIQAATENGDLHKMALMNVIMQNGDRHSGNYMITPDNKIKLIDHNLIGYERNHVDIPSYMHSNRNTMDPLHPEAKKWLDGLDSATLEQQLRHSGAPESYVSESVNRLNNLKKSDPNQRMRYFLKSAGGVQ